MAGAVRGTPRCPLRPRVTDRASILGDYMLVIRAERRVDSALAGTAIGAGGPDHDDAAVAESSRCGRSSCVYAGCASSGHLLILRPSPGRTADPEDEGGPIPGDHLNAALIHAGRGYRVGSRCGNGDTGGREAALQERRPIVHRCPHGFAQIGEYVLTGDRRRRSESDGYRWTRWSSPVPPRPAPCSVSLDRSVGRTHLHVATKIQLSMPGLRAGRRARQAETRRVQSSARGRTFSTRTFIPWRSADA